MISNQKYGRCKGLFAEQVFAGFDDLPVHFHVSLRRGQINDDINFRICQKLLRTAGFRDAEFGCQSRGTGQINICTCRQIEYNNI